MASQESIQDHDKECERISSGTILVDRYRILDNIGRGGMGFVYVGEHVTVGRKVAIKVLTHRWSADAGVAQRFRTEARAASAAGHPNIVEVFDAGELPDGRLFIAMEYLEGRDAYAELTQRGPMDIARGCRIVRDAARGIRAEHAVGVIHRDLKPENIVLTRREGVEVAKVLDFGVCIVASERVRDGAGPRATRRGVVLGTPQYMAPEQARGAAPTAAFDIYALGVLLYELLTGDLPVSGDDPIEMIAGKSRPILPLIERRSDVPLRLSDLVARCLAVKPENRPATADAVVSELEAIVEELDGKAQEIKTAIVPIARKKSRRGSVVAGLGIGAMLAAALGLVVTSNARDRKEDDPTGATLASEERGDEVTPAPPVHADPVGVEPSERASPQASVEKRASEGGDGDHRGLERALEKPAKKIADAGRRKPSAVDPDSPRCARIRERAEGARNAHDWSGVRTHTTARCWANDADRRRLRTQALKEMGMFEECARLGRTVPSDEVRRWVRLCELRQEQEPQP
jgi:serine/threonine-protein kinase